MEELDIHTLKLQNRELVSKLRQLNSEIERVSASQKATENSHLQSQKQLLAMASCWDQLVSDLNLISDQLGAQTGLPSGVDSDFYAAILSTGALNSNGISEPLAKYSEVCKKAITTVVATLQSQRSDTQKILQVVSSTSADGQVQALQSEIAQLRQERTQLIKQNDELLARERQRKKIESELKREAEAARAAEKIARDNAEADKSTLVDRVRQLERLSIEYEKLERKSKDALAYKETKEAEAAQQSQSAVVNTQNGHSTDTAADPAVRAELEETKTKLAQIEAELESLRSSKKQVMGEAEELRARLFSFKLSEQDLEREPLVRNLRRNVATLTEENKILSRDLEHHRRLSSDITTNREAQLQREADRLREDLARAHGAIDERTRALKQVEQERDKLKYELDQSMNNQHSAEAVRSMLDSINRLTGDRNRAVRDYTEARKEVQKLQADVQRLSTSDTKALHLHIEDLETKLAASKASEQRLTQKLAEQEAVVNAFKLGKTPQANELVELSARVQVLQEENAKLRDSASGPAAATDVVQLQRELDQERRKAVSLEKQLTYFSNELDTLMPSYEELLATNERLQHQIAQGEEANMAIKADSRLTDSAQQTYQRENQILVERIRNLDHKLSTQQELYRIEVRKTQQALEVSQQADSQVKMLQAVVEEHKNMNKNLLLAQDLLIARIQELNSQYTHLAQATAGFRQEAEDHRAAMAKLQDERNTLNTKLSRSQRIGLSSSGSVDSRLKEELELYKNYYYCSVCRVNRNDTVLSGCGHITCRECVDKNVKSRSRKCPACSQSFATGDIVSVFYFS